MGAYIPFNPEEMRFLNNFYTRFPLGTEPYCHTYPEGLHRFTMKAGGWWNKTIRECIATHHSAKADLLNNSSAHSDKYLNQTPAEFYAEIDLVMNELGISAEEISRHLNIKVYEQRMEPRGQSTHSADDLNPPLKPIYQALRERGYNKKDLWA